MSWLQEAIRTEPEAAEEVFFGRPEWHAEANCGRNGIIGDNPAARIAIMFPGRHPESVRAAKAVCEGCPVIHLCKPPANKSPGMWGGGTGATRRAANAGIVHGTRNGYDHYGCRCDRCRKAASKYRADRRLRGAEE